MYDLVYILDEVVKFTCPTCGTFNDCGGEVFDNFSCRKCSTKLIVMEPVPYLAHCPICKKNFDRAVNRPCAVNSKGVNLWFCKICCDTPRAMFIDETWCDDEFDEKCAICNLEPSLFVFTKAESANGEWLCEKCSQTKKGKIKIKEHEEKMKKMNEDSEKRFKE